MKGRKAYVKAHQLLDNLYAKNYIVNGNVFTKQQLFDEYIRELRNSAYAGNIQAQYELAQNYDDINFWGYNPKYNPRKSIYWYTKAANNNHPAAYNNLAGFYESGIGVSQDINKALECYRKASELGDEDGKGNYKILLKQIKNGKYKIST